jgi:hypothetical protein
VGSVILKSYHSGFRSKFESIIDERTVIGDSESTYNSLSDPIVEKANSYPVDVYANTKISFRYSTFGYSVASCRSTMKLFVVYAKKNGRSIARTVRPQQKK